MGNVNGGGTSSLYLEKENEKLTICDIGNTVDLSGFTTSFYTFPSDGYVTAYALNGKIQVNIYGATNNSSGVPISIVAGNSSEQSSIFVRKGMRFKISEIGSGCDTVFKPLI